MKPESDAKSARDGADKRYVAFLLLAGILLLLFLANTRRLYSASRLRPSPSAEASSLASDKAIDAYRGTAVRTHAASGAFPGFPIDINSATREELMMLPGVGAKTAERIIEKRTELGGFESIDDLLEVKYIGGAKLEGIRAFAVAKKNG